jgi:hypothetical protein
VSTPKKFTPFEEEIIDSILWQVEGNKCGRVKDAATKRILRATLRRIRPQLIARTLSLESGKREIDHAIPLRFVCERILRAENLSKSELLKIITEWLVSVELTHQEHREVLKNHGLSDAMPKNWDEIDCLARYKAAGIQLSHLA